MNIPLLNLTTLSKRIGKVRYKMIMLLNKHNIITSFIVLRFELILSYVLLKIIHSLIIIFFIYFMTKKEYTNIQLIYSLAHSIHKS